MIVSVPVTIAALADVIMRKRATDVPSEACLHLMGETADGTTVSAGYSFGLVRNWSCRYLHWVL